MQSRRRVKLVWMGLEALTWNCWEMYTRNSRGWGVCALFVTCSHTWGAIQRSLFQSPSGEEGHGTSLSPFRLGDSGANPTSSTVAYLNCDANSSVAASTSARRLDMRSYGGVKLSLCESMATKQMLKNKHHHQVKKFLLKAINC